MSTSRSFAPTVAALAAAIAASQPGSAGAQYAAYVFMPQIYVGMGLGADFIGNNSDLNACVSGVNCQEITGLAGGGFAIFAGLRLSEWVGLELSYDAFFHEGSAGNPYNLATRQSLRGDAKVFFLSGGGLEPYLQAGVGAHFLGDEYAVAAAGGGFQLGGGVDLYLIPSLSLGANVLYRAAYFQGFEVDDLDAGPGETRAGFVHDIYVMLNATLHYAY